MLLSCGVLERFVSVVGRPSLPAIFVEFDAIVADVAKGHCIPPQSPCTAEEVGFPFLHVDEMGTFQLYSPFPCLVSLSQLL